MKNKHLSYFILFFSIVLLAESCQNHSDYVLKRKDMERLMYDVYVAEALIDQDYQTFDTPAKKEAFLNDVFAKHKVNSAIWDSSLVWYSDRIDIYLKMNDSVKARLQKELTVVSDEMTAIYSKQKELDRRNSSPSYIPEIFTFDQLYSSHGFSFRLDTNDIKNTINEDNFDFSFQVIGLPLINKPDITTALILEYTDTTLFSSSKITENDKYILSGSKYIPDDTLTLITGFIHYTYRDSLIKKPNVILYNISLGKSKPEIEPTNNAQISKDKISEDKKLSKQELILIDSVKRD
ncbi:MAG: DUF4296 domain-containing protein [Dysgonamonadaceae bacterium]